MSVAAPTRPAMTAGSESPAQSVVGSVGSAGRDRLGWVIDVPATAPAGALELLSGPEREVLVLRVLVGLSAEQTARVLGCTPVLVRIAQHRALNRLRDLIRRQVTHHTPPLCSATTRRLAVTAIGGGSPRRRADRPDGLTPARGDG